LLESGDTDGIVAPDNIDAIHAEFGVDVAERRHHSQVTQEAKHRRLE
jgi:hypothetical protein